MNPRCPTEVLTAKESERLGEIVRARGEPEALRLVGLRSAETLYKAAAGFPVSRLTVLVIRGSLDRIG